MVGTNPLAQEKFWSNKAECDDAERKYYQNLYGKVRPIFGVLKLN